MFLGKCDSVDSNIAQQFCDSLVAVNYVPWVAVSDLSKVVNIDWKCDQNYWRCCRI